MTTQATVKKIQIAVAQYPGANSNYQIAINEFEPRNTGKLLTWHQMDVRQAVEIIKMMKPEKSTQDIETLLTEQLEQRGSEYKDCLWLRWQIG